MKLKAVEKLCKKRGVVCLFDEPAVVEYVEDEEIKLPPRQWMGDGAAVYPLDGVPYLDEGGVYAIFDVNDKQKDKLRVSHQETLPEGICFDDVCRGEVALEIVNLKMALGGTDLILLKDAEGHLLTIDAEYKRPFENWKDCELFRRDVLWECVPQHRLFIIPKNYLFVNHFFKKNAYLVERTNCDTNKFESFVGF